MKTTFLITAMIIVIIQSACTGIAGVARINVDSAGLAVKGYDTVAYFAGDSAVPGDPAFEYVWNGAKWIFATAKNLEKFKADPEAYAPQFGGYCSYAVSQGYTADGDPTQWKIVDGKLYLNYNQKAKEAWEKDQETLIQHGMTNWAEFQTRKPEHKG